MDIVLKQVYADLIFSDLKLQALIAEATGRSAESIKRWAKKRNELLLLHPVLDTLRVYLKLSNDVVLTERVSKDSVDGLGNLVA